MQPNISCSECDSKEWANKSRSLSQVERDSGCKNLWYCENCGLELLEHKNSSSNYIEREEYSPIDFLS